MGLIGCPKMLVRNCRYWLHNHLEECISQEKRMFIKLLLLNNYRIQRLPRAKSLLAATHFSIFFFHTSEHSWICSGALFMCSLIHIYYVFHVVKVDSFHELTFGNRKVPQMWDLVILLWTFLHGPLDKTSKRICFPPKRLEIECPWKCIYLFAEKKVFCLMGKWLENIASHYVPNLVIIYMY